MHTPASVVTCPRVLTTTYPGRPGVVCQVRADLRCHLNGCPAADDAVLCLSELAANAVRHSRSGRPGGTFTVRAGVWPREGVRLEVIDDGGPWCEEPGPDQGRGLQIVCRLSADWGVITTASRRTVWANLTWRGTSRVAGDDVGSVGTWTGACSAVPARAI